MIAPRIAGLMCAQSTVSFLDTETKSGPRNTPTTPPTAKIPAASGDAAAASAVGKSAEPDGMTACPGRNLSVAGFGVASVWMNMRASLAGANR